LTTAFKLLRNDGRIYPQALWLESDLRDPASHFAGFQVEHAIVTAVK
jgi:hypothetical protein